MICKTQGNMDLEKNRGTDTATAILSETIATALGNEYKVNIVLRDIAKHLIKFGMMDLGTNY